MVHRRGSDQRRDDPGRVFDELPDHRPHGTERRSWHCCCAQVRSPPRTIRSSNARLAQASARTTSSAAFQRDAHRPGLTFVFLALYYRAFGAIACVVLLANVVLLVALMSLLQASLVVAWHCRHRADHRHGRGRERADLRARA